MGKVSSSGPAVAKRVRVRDALRQFASVGQYVSLAKAAEMLDVSEYLVKRMLWEHEIELPRRPAARFYAGMTHRSHSGIATGKKERVRAALLRLQGEGLLTSRKRAAETLGVSIKMVARTMRELGIEPSRSPRGGRPRGAASADSIVLTAYGASGAHTQSERAANQPFVAGIVRRV